MPSLKKLWPVWIVLAACVWLAFSPALGNGFVDWDDHLFIVENYAFQGLGWEQVRFAFTTSLGGVYQPLGWLVQSGTYEFCGLDPRGYHRVSLFFHVGNVILLHLVCIRILVLRMPERAARLGGWLGWLCGAPVLVYAIHPLRVEPVAWASCQAYLPSVTLSLLALLAYFRAHSAGGTVRPRWMIASSVLVVLAVLTKASAVVLPFLFVLVDVSLLRRFGIDRPSWPSVRGILIEKIPILTFCLAFTVVGIVAKRTSVEPDADSPSAFVGRIAQASFGAWFYLEKTVWPFGITAFYPRPEQDDFRTPLFAASVVGISLAVWAALWQRRRRPWWLGTLTAYVLIASPYLGLVRVGVPVAADRYSYAPTMAWVVLGCAGLCRLTQRPGPRLAWLGAGTLIVAGALAALTAAQCRVWASSEHLWQQALEHAGWSAELHDIAGASLADQGKWERAIGEFRAALRLRPDYFDATYRLGVALDNWGDSDAAIGYLREARRLRPTEAAACTGLGAALEHQGQLDEAVVVYRDGLALRANSARLHFNLGHVLLRQRNVDEAIRHLSTAIELQRRYTEAYETLGGALVLRGRLDEAVDQYEQAIRLNPDDTRARISLGLTLARLRRSVEAERQLREAVRRDPRNPEAHHILGAILVAMGRVDEATAEYEETLRLRPDHAKARAFLAMAKGSRSAR